mmetsp:Transcript_113904/g.318199  ORF Transcript_113904/g.318199 Transcript_113904/m.318199 type:complete len:218 (-) Transcript_113904:343-996(-)
MVQDIRAGVQQAVLDAVVQRQALGDGGQHPAHRGARGRGVLRALLGPRLLGRRGGALPQDTPRQRLRRQHDGRDPRAPPRGLGPGTRRVRGEHRRGAAVLPRADRGRRGSGGPACGGRAIRERRGRQVEGGAQRQVGGPSRHEDVGHRHRDVAEDLRGQCASRVGGMVCLQGSGSLAGRERQESAEAGALDVLVGAGRKADSVRVQLASPGVLVEGP